MELEGDLRTIPRRCTVQCTIIVNTNKIINSGVKAFNRTWPALPSRGVCNLGWMSSFKKWTTWVKGIDQNCHCHRDTRSRILGVKLLVKQASTQSFRPRHSYSYAKPMKNLDRRVRRHCQVRHCHGHEITPGIQNKTSTEC